MIIKIVSFLKKKLRPKLLHNVLRTNNSSKKALLVYLTEPFLIKRDSPQFRSHSNRMTNILIAECLSRVGYSVDVLNYNDVESAKKIKSHYDLILGLGLAFEYLVKNKKDNFDKKIYFATGAPAKYQNSRELERVEYVNKKYGAKFNLRRQVDEDNSVLNDLDDVLVLGNQYSKMLFSKITTTPIEVLSGHIDTTRSFFNENKDYKKVKKSFLFLTGAGKILCGLDLLIEIFLKHKDWDLYICGGFAGEEDFYELFSERISNSSNMHMIGWVDTGSAEFKKIVDECGTMIMPVVSGGSNGSIIIGMNHGLIPILSKDCSVDIGNHGMLINDITESNIEAAINSYIQKDESWLSNASKCIYDLTKTSYSEENFKKQLNNIFNKWSL